MLVEPMTTRKKFELISSAMALLIVVGCIVGLYRLVGFLWLVFAQINPTVGAGIVAATATIIVSVFSVLVAKRLEQKAALLKEHRERKTPVYEEMVKLIFRFTFADKLGLPPLTEQELLTKMAWFTENLVIWGSDDLLLAWNRFRTRSVEHAASPNFNILFEVERLLLAIRKDLGHSNRGVVQGKILELFINDIHQYLPR